MSKKIFDSSLRECDAGKLLIETFDDGYLTLCIDASSDFPTFIVPPTHQGVEEIVRIIKSLEGHLEILTAALKLENFRE